MADGYRSSSILGPVSVAALPPAGVSPAHARLRTVCLVAFLAAVHAPTPSYAGMNMQQLSKVGDGYARQIALFGAYGYLADTWGIQILDLSNSEQPRSLATFKTPDGFVYGAATGRNHLYVAATTGLLVYDLTDPLSPSLVSESQDGWITRVSRHGGRLYAGGVSGFFIYDLGVPSSPELLGTWTEPDLYAVSDFEVANGIAYLAADEVEFDYTEARLITLDLAAPHLPVVLTRWEPDYFSLESGSIALGAEHVFLSAGSYINAFSLNADGSGAFNRTFSIDGSVDDLLVDETSLIVGTTQGILTYGVMDLALRDSLDLPSFKGLGELSGNLLYLPGMERGLHVLDISDPYDLRAVGHLNVPSYTSDITLNGHLAYVSGESFFVMDLSDPGSPQVLKELPVRGYRSVISDDRLYLAGGYEGIVLYDISVPNDPREIHRIQPTRFVFDIDVQGDLVFSAESRDGLRIYDWSIPSNPVRIGSVPLSDSRCIGVNGSLVYVGHDFPGGIDIVDASDPQIPRLIASLPSDYPVEFEFVGSLLHLDDGWGGLKTFDNTVPTTPVLLSTFSLPPALHGMDRQGGLVGLAFASNGIHVLDMRDPVHPTEVAWHETPDGDNASELVFRGDLVVAALWRGVATYRLIGDAGKLAQPPRPLEIAPNPFRGGTATVTVTLGSDGRARLEAYDVAGRSVRAWPLSGAPNARQEIRWDGTSGQGKGLPPGAYFLRLVTNRESATGRVLILP